MLETLKTRVQDFGLDIDFLLVLLLVAAIGFAAALVMNGVLRRISRAEKAKLLGRISQRIAQPLMWLLPVFSVSLWLSTQDDVDLLLTRVLLVSGIALGGWLAVRVVRAFVEHVIDTHRMDHSDNLTARRIQTQFRVLGRVVNCVILIATAAGILMAIPGIRNIGVSLFASAGIAGLAVGLAARPVLSNVLAGIQIAITQPIRLDDVVIVEGEWGWIEEINLTFVVVRIWDLRRLVLPISYFIEKPFQNWTRTNADILGSVFLSMDYTVPIAQIREQFGAALRASEHWDGKVEVVHVTDCTERAMQIRLLMSASNSPAAWELRCEVREKLIDFLQREHPGALPKLRLAEGYATSTDDGRSGEEAYGSTQ